MASGTDEIQASVYTEIDLVDPTRLLLLKHVRLVLIVEEFNDRHPRVTVVNIVAEAGGINDCQSNYHANQSQHGNRTQ